MTGLPEQVDLLAIGSVGFAPIAERAVLEEALVKVNLISVGRPTHIVEALSDQAASPWLILSCHGQDGRIALDELHPDVAAGEPFNDWLTPADVERYASLPGRVVFSTGCETGAQALADAFLRAGCRAYIAPDDSPDGYTPLVFLANLFYELGRGRELHETVEMIRSRDGELGMFRLFEARRD